MGSNFARSDIPLIYFFVSEALTNVAKHAQATRATLRLTVDNDQLTVEVADDGIGGASLESGGSGLAGLTDRIAALEGRLALRSEPDAGTTLYATVPLKGGSQRESRSGPLEK
jgi:signal transduction histidine kinase